MDKITQDQANEIINEIFENEMDDITAHDIWFLGDMIEGMPYAKGPDANIRALKILENMNQEDEDVKKLRGFLKL